MKRIGLAMVVMVGMCLMIAQAQDDGFYTRNVVKWNNSLKQVAGSFIECWRSSNQSPNPERIAIVGYNPPGEPFYLHWSANEPNSTHIDYGWDYSFIGWYVNATGPTPDDTVFSDYTLWQRYDEDTLGPWFYDLVLQYSTTRPTMPPRGK
ncbi:MAG: hypothetical protein ACPL0F_07855 [bacterium]|jgi:hypothetical protein